MFFELILLVYLAFRNGTRAKLKGQNPVLWGFITVMAYITTLLAGGLFVVFNFCKEAMDMNAFSSLDAKVRENAAIQLTQAIAANPLHGFTIELFGIGGYLLIRYILEQKPDKKEPEIHWMDRMGGDQ